MNHSEQRRPRGLPAPRRTTHRSVFAQLAEGGERLLVGLAHPVDHPLGLGTQHVALRALLLLLVLFLLIAVIPYCYREETRGTERKVTICVSLQWVSIRSLHSERIAAVYKQTRVACVHIVTTHVSLIIMIFSPQESSLSLQKAAASLLSCDAAR